MTWLGDRRDNAAGDEREKLLAKREEVVREVEALKLKPLPSKSQACLLGRQEDLVNLAKKIKAIDKKLGRL